MTPSRGSLVSEAMSNLSAASPLQQQAKKRCLNEEDYIEHEESEDKYMDNIECQDVYYAPYSKPN